MYGDKYVCPNCSSILASNLRGAKFYIFLFIWTPIIFGTTSLITYSILGSALKGKEIIGDEACEAVAFVLAIVVTFYFFMKQNALKRA